MCHTVMMSYEHDDSGFYYGYVDGARGIPLERDGLWLKPRRFRPGVVRFEFTPCDVAARAKVNLGVDVVPMADQLERPVMVAFRLRDIVFASNAGVSVSRILPVGSAPERAMPVRHVNHIHNARLAWLSGEEYLVCWKALLVTERRVVTPMFGAEPSGYVTHVGVVVQSEPVRQEYVISLRRSKARWLMVRAGLHVYPSSPSQPYAGELVPALVKVSDVLFATADDVSVRAYTIPAPDVASELGVTPVGYESVYSRIVSFIQQQARCAYA